MELSVFSVRSLINNVFLFEMAYSLYYFCMSHSQQSLNNISLSYVNANLKSYA